MYLQEKITKITAQHLRKMTFDEGLASPELLTTHHSTQSESPRDEELASSIDSYASTTI